MTQLLLRRPALATVVLQTFAPKSMAAYLVGGKLQDSYVNLFVWLFAQVVTVDALSALSLWFDYLLPSVLPENDDHSSQLALDFATFVLQRGGEALAASQLDARVAQRGMTKLLVLMGAPRANTKLQGIWPLLQKLMFFASATAPSAFFVAVLTHAAHKNLPYRTSVCAFFSSLLFIVLHPFPLALLYFFLLLDLFDVYFTSFPFFPFF